MAQHHPENWATWRLSRWDRPYRPKWSEWALYDLHSQNQTCIRIKKTKQKQQKTKNTEWSFFCFVLQIIQTPWTWYRQVKRHQKMWCNFLTVWANSVDWRRKELCCRGSGEWWCGCRPWGTGACDWRTRPASADRAGKSLARCAGLERSEEGSPDLRRKPAPAGRG